MGKYVKKCKGCRKEFISDSRNTQFGPPELCKCAERRKAHRNKRARERRAYARDPETFKAKSRSRAAARKLVLGHFGVVVKGTRVEFTSDAYIGMRCNSPGCGVTFTNELLKEAGRRAKNGISNRGMNSAAMKKLLRKLEAHHRDHDWSNNTFVNYPEGSNIELLCRTHHEHADRAKAGKAELILWKPQRQSWFEYLVEVYSTDRRRFYLTPASTLHHEWENA